MFAESQQPRPANVLALGRRVWVCGTRRKYVHVGSFAPSMALYGPANPPPPTLDSGLVAKEDQRPRRSFFMRYRALVRSVHLFGNLTCQRHHVEPRPAWLIFASARDPLSGAAGGLPPEGR